MASANQSRIVFSMFFNKIRKPFVMIVKLPYFPSSVAPQQFPRTTSVAADPELMKKSSEYILDQRQSENLKVKTENVVVV